MRAPVHLVFAMIMAFTISAQLALIFWWRSSCWAVLVHHVPRLQLFLRVFKKYDDLNDSVQENVSAIRVVKAFVREDFESEKFSKACENVYNLLFVNAESLASTSPPC